MTTFAAIRERRLILIAVLLWAGFGAPVADGRQAPPTVHSEQLGEKVHRVWIESEGAQLGPNLVALITPLGSVLVDTHFNHPYLAQLIRGEVDRLSSDAPIRYIVNTHYHPDHNGGNGFLKESTPILAHVNVRKKLSAGTTAIGLTVPGRRVEIARRPAGDLPDSTITDNWFGEVGGEHIHIKHYPKAHTDGDVIVYFEDSGVAAVGDLYWPGEFPSVDVLNGGSAEGLLAAIDSLVSTLPAGTRIVSGHGPVTDMEALRSYAEMLRSTITHVLARVNSADDLGRLLSTGLPEDWAGWGSDLVPDSTWIRTVAGSRGEAGPMSEWSTWTDREGLPENEVRAVFADSRGRLWFGTRSSGVGMFSGGEWTYFDASDGLVSNGIAGFTEGPGGRIWAVGAGGYSLFDGFGWSAHDSVEELRPRVIFSARTAADGAIWVATSGGAAVFDGTTWTTFSEEDGLPHTVVHDVLTGTDGSAWFACRTGLAHLERGHVTVHYPEKNFGSVLMDSAGRIWFGTRTGGAFMFDGMEWTQHLDNHDVRPVLIDSDGNVWAVSDTEGAFRYDGVDWVQFGPGDGLASSRVFDIAQAPDGSILFATDAGVSRYYSGSEF